VISRRTIVLLGLTILLFVIPQAFYAGELADCRSKHAALMKGATQSSDGAIVMDVCSMIDFGMHDWMRYAFVASIGMLFAAAA
jgi:hypothetical protein